MRIKSAPAPFATPVPSNTRKYAVPATSSIWLAPLKVKVYSAALVVNVLASNASLVARAVPVGTPVEPKVPLWA